MREPLPHRRFSVALMTLGLVLAPPVEAQEISSDTDKLVTAERIETELAAIEAATQIDDDQKASLKETLLKAKGALETAKAFEGSAKQFANDAGNVGIKANALNESLSKNEPAAPEIAEDATVESLSLRLATVKADLQTANNRSADLAAKPAKRRARLTELPGLIAEMGRSLNETQDQLTQGVPASETAVESTARSLLSKARNQELIAKIESMEREQAAHLATAELLPLEQKVLEQQIVALNKEAKLLQETIAAMQSQKAQQTTAALEQTKAEVPAALKEMAQKNVDLAKTRSGLINESLAIEKALEEVRAAVDEVTAELETSKDRVKAVGLTDALGLLFRQRRQDFDETRFLYRPRESLNQLIHQYQIDSFRLEDELASIKRQLGDTEPSSLDWEIENIAWDKLTETESAWVLQRKRQKLIEDNLQTLNKVLQDMLISDTQRRLLLKEIDGFNEFVDTHLFWTRSAPVISFSELSAAPRTLRWMTDPTNWAITGNQIVETIQSRPLQSVGLISLLIGIFYARGSFRRTIATEGKNANRFSATFQSTIQSLVATIGAAAAWPALLGVMCFLCLGTSSGNPFVQGVGTGLGITALFVTSRDFLREICRNEGLGESHFGWSAVLRSHLRWHLRWYAVIGGIIIFLLALFHAHPETLVRSFATRAASTSLFLVTATFHHLVLRQRSPLYAELVRVNPQSLLFRRRKLIWAFAVGLPVLFGMMSLAGYLETTFRLGQSLQSTFFLLVIIVVLLGLLARWLTLRRRDLSRRQAREARQRQLSAASEPETGVVANEAGIVLEDETAMDLPTLDEQTRQTAFVLATIVALLGLAFIWSDLLPAIAYLDEVIAWKIGDGDSIEEVSLKDLLFALVSIFGLLFAIRNSQSLLELFVLSKTRLDSGARYAITTLLRYAITVIGVIVIFNLLSVPYDKLGWLVAAISVGLGFGLQEIVANFVCGIILLLERPVRVGDVVTIDDTTGVVSRIQMRATTVTNWDRKELVIPNKDLITQKLLNWSLSNVVNRLTINVGVAYGNNTDEVRKILKEIVSGHPDVMEDPPPLINFETFGDSSLNFVIRLYLPTLDNRIEVTHQINTAIAERFAKAGIEIPFPQRDVHLVQDPVNGGSEGDGSIPLRG